MTSTSKHHSLTTSFLHPPLDSEGRGAGFPFLHRQYPKFIKWMSRENRNALVAIDIVKWDQCIEMLPQFIKFAELQCVHQLGTALSSHSSKHTYKQTHTQRHTRTQSSQRASTQKYSTTVQLPNTQLPFLDIPITFFKIFCSYYDFTRFSTLSAQVGNRQTRTDML